MNYEEKYKQALERAKEKRDEYKRLDGEESFVPSDIEYIFPELKESEDEQHRKWILEYFYDGLRKSDEQFKDQYKSAIAWLEKQGEQSSWDEKDEEMLKEILDEIYPYGECSDYPSAEEQSYYYTRNRMVDWLKSIKPNHWKPTENQMSMLLAAIHDGNNANSESCHNVLQSLYNDLKKL